MASRWHSKPDQCDSSRQLLFAVNHPELEGLAGLANLFGKDRALLDALEDLFGFLTIRRCGIAHDIFAREIVAALLQHLHQRFSRSIAVKGGTAGLVPLGVIPVHGL